MILSLLKVIILSAICSLAPIKAVSSEVQTDLTADIGKSALKHNLPSYQVGNVGYDFYLFDTDYSDISDVLTIGSTFTFYGDIIYGLGSSDGEYLHFKGIMFEYSTFKGIFLVGEDNSLFKIYDSRSVSAYSYHYCIYIKGGFTSFESTDLHLTRDNALAYFNKHFNSSYVYFQFDNQINYNAFFDYTLTSSYFEYETSDNIGECIFLSDNQIYSNIVIETASADGKTFLVGNYEDNAQYNYVYYTVPTSPIDAYCYFYGMQFVKPTYSEGVYGTNHEYVNVRNTNYYSDNGTQTEFIDNSSSWLINSYREIKIYNMSESQFNILKKFNISGFVWNYEYITNNGVSYIGNEYQVISTNNTGFFLDDTFSLINVGLKGILSFMNIKIFPQVSLGQLILVPFAISMLLFVVNLFKR